MESATCEVAKIYYGLGKEHVCPVCGNKFLVPYSPRLGGGTRWAYKYREGNKKKYACRYSCYQVATSKKVKSK